MRNKKIFTSKLQLFTLMSGITLTALLIWAIAYPPPPQDSIYRNIYINGIPVGGMTPEEAEAALMHEFQPGYDNMTFTFTTQGVEVAQRSFRDLGIRLDFSEPVQTASNFGSRRNLAQRISRLMGRPYHIIATPCLQFQTPRIEAAVQGVADKINSAPINASFVMDDGGIVVKPEVAGISVDAAHATQQLLQLLHNHTGGIIELPVLPIPPRFSTSHFQFPVSIIGAYTTPVSIEVDARVRNITKAVERVHNHVLYPGDVFSAGGLIGAHLPGSGYEAAVVLVRGEPAYDIGGGVCQVVTTIYNAVLKAELTVVQRHNHSARVSYAGFGFDATIAGDYLDFKFKNNTPHPMLIVSGLRGGELYVHIHGYDNRPANRTLQFSAQRVDVIPPEPYKEVVDASLAPGERVVTLESQLGYRYEVFKHVFVDGVEVEVVKVNTSSYRPLQGVISVGRE